MNDKKIKILQLLNIIFFVLMILANFLAEYLPIGGKSTKQLSDQYPNLFTPAAITFSIWIVIYLMLLFFSIYQGKTLISKKINTEVDRLVNKIDFYFILSCILNLAWIIVWHYEMVGLSVIIMLGLLLTLIKLNLEIEKDFEKVGRNEKLLVHIPFCIYLAWISIATISNITALLVHLGWNGFGFSEEFWTITMIIVGTIITSFVVIRINNIFYGLVVIWAFIGIIIKRAEVEGIIAFKNIVYTAAICIIIIYVVDMLQIKKWLKS